MQYMGGKHRTAPHLVPAILEMRGDRRTWVEPFLGGGAVAELAVPHFDRAMLADSHPDLILMWKALRNGWIPPSSISEDEYAKLKQAQPSAWRGLVGFGGSFAGRWFAGYARPSSSHPVPPLESAQRAVLRQIAAFRGAVFLNCDYRHLTGMIGPDCVVYCDPPYAGTTGYQSGWDSERFQATARKWAETGALVLVSEYQMPAGWREVWARERTQPMRFKGEAAKSVVERLYTPDLETL